MNLVSHEIFISVTDWSAQQDENFDTLAKYNPPQDRNKIHTYAKNHQQKLYFRFRALDIFKSCWAIFCKPLQEGDAVFV